MDDDRCFVSVRELARRIAARDLSPVELVQAQLDRIDALDGVLRAFIHVSGEEALSDAHAAEADIAAGRYKGPLHGVTVAHKDIIDVRGLPTTAATRVIAPRTAADDAPVAAALRTAGTICLGKLNLIEFASGSLGVYGHTRNPWNLSAYPGGSSSGSGAALAAGMVTLATGTDTGGSIRNPASFCGLAGLRPTYELLSRRGCVPLSWSQDTIGPMARTVEDAAYMLDAMAAGASNRRGDENPSRRSYVDALEGGVAGLRVGIPDSYYFADLDPEIAAAMDDALSALTSLGAELVPVSLSASAYAAAASWAIAYSESYVYHRRWFETRSREYTPAFLHKIAAAGLLSAEERLVAQQVRQVVTREFNNVFKMGVDIVVTPSSRTLASSGTSRPASVTPTLRWDGEMASLTRPASVAGLPALSIPIGFANDNTPIGMQLIGRPWSEATLLQAGHAYEQNAGRAHARPGTFPETIPPPFSPAAPEGNGSRAAGGASPEWIRDMARLLDCRFVTEDDLAPMAAHLSPVKEQLAAASAELDLDVEPPTRPAGLA